MATQNYKVLFDTIGPYVKDDVITEAQSAPDEKGFKYLLGVGAIEPTKDPLFNRSVASSADLDVIRGENDSLRKQLESQTKLYADLEEEKGKLDTEKTELQTKYDALVKEYADFKKANTPTPTTPAVPTTPVTPK